MKKILMVLVLAALSGCYAKPTEADADRVIQEFMTLRFQAPLNPELSQKTDKEIFELACRSKRVKCDLVKDIVRTRNPELYKTLAGDKP